MGEGLTAAAKNIFTFPRLFFGRWGKPQII
jgi:hypothetical protein